MVNFVMFFEQQFYFSENVSVAVFVFVDIVAGVGGCVDNGPDAIAVVGCDFISTERVCGFGRVQTS